MNSSNIVRTLSKMNVSTPWISNDVYETDAVVHPENVVVIIIGIVSFLANALLLYVMYKDPLKAFRSKISYLVICLGMADMLTALNGLLYGFLQPLNMYHITLWYSLWVTVMVSVLTVSGMCIERWLAIVYPFRSKSICTKQATLYFCIGVWIFCAAASTSIRFLPLIMPFVLSCTMEALLIIIVILYLVILRYFRRTQRQTSAVQEVSPQNPKKRNDEESGGKRKSTKYKSLETQLLIVVSILVLLLFVTFIPYNLATQIYYGYLLFNKQPCPAINVFRRYFFPFKFLNFFLNPFVYAWRLAQYRKSFALVVWNWKKKRVCIHPTANGPFRVNTNSAENKCFQTEGKHYKPKILN